LEIGCGAGRITKQLSSYFAHVDALDVSEKMLDLAKAQVDSSSTTFNLSNGTDIPLEDGSVSAVFSTFVFQHLDSVSIGGEYFEEIARVLKPGGSMMIHLPIYRWPGMSALFFQIYSGRMRLEALKAAICRRLMDFGLAEPYMGTTCYPIEFFYQELPKMGFADIEISILAPKSNNDPHPFVLARKKA
jgi:ubiquinone/menaquinone biosynthesis C-methylase UbiE